MKLSSISIAAAASTRTILERASLAVSAAIACCPLASAAPSPQSGNLLLNPDFEAGLVGWTVVSGSALDVSYGTTDVPSNAFATHIAGGFRLLRDTGANTAVEQVVTVGSIPAGTRVRASGYFGGHADKGDDGRLVVRYLNTSNAELGRDNLPYVTVANRNGETVLLARSGIFTPPPGTTKLAARIEFREVTCCTSWSSADSMFLELTTDQIIPPALPLDTELLVNANFDQGWSATSPLTPVVERGWEGIAGRTITKAYANGAFDVPSLAVTNVIAGGPRFLGAIDTNGRLRQTLDVRGNSAQIAAGLELDLHAYLGGAADRADMARVDVGFRDSSGLPISSLPPLGPVSSGNRNLETVLVRREFKYVIPNGAAFIDIDVTFVDAQCCFEWGIADNLGARLTLPTTPPPLPIDLNIIHNGTFELGSLPGSPLVLNDPTSWFGVTAASVQVVAYGTIAEVPTATFANTNALGGSCCKAAVGVPTLRKHFSLAGHATKIAQGTLFVETSVWLGGFSNKADNAQVDLRFLDASGIQVTSLSTLDPVTVAERANQTILIPRSQTVQVPAGAAALEVDIRFNDLTCCFEWGIADEVQVLLRDVAPIGTNYCATTPNSAGAGATMSASGSGSIAANDLILRAVGVPSPTSGLFFYGAGQTQLPYFNGLMCVTGPRRLPLVNANNGTLSYAMNYGLSARTILDFIPGSTWNFQAWFRDSTGGGALVDFSDGYQITFAP